MRLTQEQLLRIGGWRFLRMLGIPAGVCHLNEGHAAFAVLERGSQLVSLQKHPKSWLSGIESSCQVWQRSTTELNRLGAASGRDLRS